MQKNNSGSFCFVCGHFTLTLQRPNITEFVERDYLAFFGIKMEDEDKYCSPQKPCTICIERLQDWTKFSDSKIEYL